MSTPRAASPNRDSLPSANSRPSIRRKWWKTKRFVLLSLFIALWLFVAYQVLLAKGSESIRRKKSKKPTVIHADRYSKQYKYRPAASPVITETLADGTIRLRGAFPTPHQEHDEL